MNYLGYIKKYRLKTIWEEGTKDCRFTGPEAQWTLLIDCGKDRWIGLKSLKPATVAYYRPGQLSTKMRERLVSLGAVIDRCDGENMVYVPLAKLPELCKIVRAKKKRTLSPEHLEKLLKSNEPFRYKAGSEAQIETQKRHEKSK